MRNAYIRALYDLAEGDKNILSLVADNGAIVYDKFRTSFPDQFINFGISEANMISAAAGLASCDFIPFAYTISNFLTMRGFEQVRNDICIQKQNVTLVGVGGGFKYSVLGPTHHGTEDIALMRVLPNMKVAVPATPIEAFNITKVVAYDDSPWYIRLEGTKEKELFDDSYQFEVGKGIVVSEGTDVTIMSIGSISYEVHEAVQALKDKGIHARHINMSCVKPIDSELVLDSARSTTGIITVEEHNVIGGLGDAVADVLVENEVQDIKLKKMGVRGHFVSEYGSQGHLRSIEGISKAHIVWEVEKLLKL